MRNHPLCADHLKRGQFVAAEVVDHITPHRGDSAVFWDKANWQSLCKRCHDSAKQAEERSGIIRGCDLSGLPIDPRHPWRGGQKV